MLAVVVTFLSIIIMIVVHEWGHFIAGRICGAKISEFSIGMGPLIIQRKEKKGTSFSLRALPVGGYCAFEESSNGILAGNDYEDLPLHKRMFIFIAGPFMNIFLAAVIYFFLMSVIGMPISIPVVDSTMNNMPATGVLSEGDEILAVDGKEVDGNSKNMLAYINESEGKEIVLTVKNGEQERTEKITPVFNKSTEKYVLGFTQKTKNVTLPLLQSVQGSILATWTSITGIFDSLSGLFSGRYKTSDMSGIIGITSYASGLAGSGAMGPFIMFMALISVNLGIMNLLPVPGLDGSKVLFGIYELIFRKRVSENLEKKLTILGFSLLALLFVVVSIQDVVKIF